MNKKWLSFLVIGLLLILAACGSSDEAGENETNQNEVDQNDTNQNETDGDSTTYTIGASQFVEHPSLDVAYEGFQAAIADAGLEVEYNLQSAQADPNNTIPIAQNFVADGVDLIFANATPSAQGALKATEDAKDIPVIFTSVTDAVGAELVEAMDQPGENITGVVDLHPDAIKNTVTFIDKYFEGSTVGVIYNSGEQNSVAQIDAVKAELEGTSLSIVERPVATSADVQQAANTLVGEADVFYIVTDNTVVSALESVISVANEQDIPLMVGEGESLAKGGFVTYGIDYYTIGYRAGEMAVEVLTGEKTTADIPVEIPPSMQLFINKTAAEEQAIEWNDEWDDIAQFIETNVE